MHLYISVRFPILAVSQINLDSAMGTEGTEKSAMVGKPIMANII